MKTELMFTKNNAPIGVIAAALYIVFLAIFAFNSNYLNIVLLYIGNAVFFGVILLGIIRLNKMAGGNASSDVLFMNGIKSTILGVAITTIVGIALYYIQKATVPETQILLGAPDSGGDVNNDDMFLTIVINSVVVNPILGFIAAILGSGVIKRNQKTGKGNESVQ